METNKIMAKGITAVLANLEKQHKQINASSNKARASSLSRFQNVVGASLVASQQNKQRLIAARQARENRLQNLNDEYARKTSKVLSKQQLNALIDASKIIAPTFTSIYTGYELSRASEAQRERDRIDRIEKRDARDNALDVAMYKSDQQDLGVVRSSANTVMNKEQQNINTTESSLSSLANKTATIEANDITREDTQDFSADQQQKRIESQEGQTSDRISSREKIAKESASRVTARDIRARIDGATKTTSKTSSYLDILGGLSPVTSTPASSAPDSVTTEPLGPTKAMAEKLGTTSAPASVSPTPKVTSTIKTASKKPIPKEEPVLPTINIDEKTYGELAKIAFSPETRSLGLNGDKLLKMLVQSVGVKEGGYGMFGISEEQMKANGVDVNGMSDEEKNIKGNEMASYLIKKGISDSAKTSGILPIDELNKMDSDSRTRYQDTINKHEDDMFMNGLDSLGLPVPENINIEINTTPNVSIIEDYKNDVIASSIPNDSAEVQLAIEQLNDISQPALDKETFLRKQEGITDTLIASGVDEQKAKDATFDNLYDDYLSTTMGDTNV